MQAIQLTQPTLPEKRTSHSRRRNGNSLLLGGAVRRPCTPPPSDGIAPLSLCLALTGLGQVLARWRHDDSTSAGGAGRRRGTARPLERTLPKTSHQPARAAQRRQQQHRLMVHTSRAAEDSAACGRVISQHVEAIQRRARNTQPLLNLSKIMWNSIPGAMWSALCCILSASQRLTD